MLTYGFAQSQYGKAEQAIGKTLDINGTTFTVIGIAPPGFTGPVLRPVDVFVTMQSAVALQLGENWETNPNMRWLQIVARMTPGTTPEQLGAASTTAGSWRPRRPYRIVPCASTT